MLLLLVTQWSVDISSRWRYSTGGAVLGEEKHSFAYSLASEFAGAIPLAPNKAYA